MTEQKQHGDNLTVSGCETDYFDLIPVELVINILSRLLSMKSLAKCRCVSKRWSLIIRRPNYDLLFPIKSTSTPRFLFAIEDREELIFYSSPQPQNSDKNSTLVATRHHTEGSVTDYYNFCSHIGKLVCSQHFGNNYTVAVVSNPITGEYVTSPKVTSTVKFYFGYDPIEKQCKVLCVNSLCFPQEYQVLTLETGNLSWRKIHCCSTVHHYDSLLDNGICIDGVLYYTAMLNSSKKCIIVCFDIRSEKFRFVTIDHDLETKLSRWCSLRMINYKCRLGIIVFDDDRQTYRSFELWVLEDAEEHKWSDRLYRIPQTHPPCLKSIDYLYCAGMIGSHEIVFYERSIYNTFSLFVYNLEGNSMRSVDVSAIDQGYLVYILSNFAEDVQFIM